MASFAELMKAKREKAQETAAAGIGPTVRHTGSPIGKGSLPAVKKMTQEEIIEQGRKDSAAIAAADISTSAPKTGFAARFNKPATAVAPAAAPKVPAKAPAKPVESDDEDLSNLADMTFDDDEGDVAPVKYSQFDDETPATKPTREMPEDADKSLLSFIGLIDSVYEFLHEPELIGDVIKNIMIELKDHPQYMQQVCPEDMHIWVRTMRRSMGIARIKKTEAKTTRKSGGKAKAVDADMASAFADLGLGSFD